MAEFPWQSHSRAAPERDYVALLVFAAQERLEHSPAPALRHPNPAPAAHKCRPGRRCRSPAPCIRSEPRAGRLLCAPRRRTACPRKRRAASACHRGRRRSLGRIFCLRHRAPAARSRHDARKRARPLRSSSADRPRSGCRRAEADMRVWANIETCLSPQHGRTHLIEKHERARCAALRRRKNAANLEPLTKIAGSRHYDRLKCRAHGSLPCSDPPSKCSKMA
jgi:hypothetical protein